MGIGIMKYLSRAILPQVHCIKVVTEINSMQQYYDTIVVILPNASNSIKMSPFISAEVHV